jgi:hypothetical protein
MAATGTAWMRIKRKDDDESSKIYAQHNLAT